eukprot:11001278-Ditylum_brightwellii.AAC.1
MDKDGSAEKKSVPKGENMAETPFLREEATGVEILVSACEIGNAKPKSPKTSTVYQRKHQACKGAGPMYVQKTQETVRSAASSSLSTTCIHVQKEGKDDRNAESFSANSNTKERKAKHKGSKGSPKKSTVYQRKHWACKEAGRVNVQKRQETDRSAASSPSSTACT